MTLSSGSFARSLRRLVAFAIVGPLALVPALALAGQLTLSPGSADFGDVPLAGTVATLPVRIINHGSPTQISGIQSEFGCAEFGIQGIVYPVTLGDGDTVTVQVTYDPANRGFDICSFLILDDNGVGDFLGATGQGTAPNLITFDTFVQFTTQPFTTGVPETLWVTLINTGNQAITEGHLSAALDSGVNFSMGPIALPIEPDDAADVWVAFHPQTPGLQNDQITLSLDNDPANIPDLHIALQGTWSDDPTAVGDAPLAASALRIVPSPTRGTTQFACAVPRAGLVRLEVRDIAGRLVARRESFAPSAGVQRLTLSRGSDWSPAPGVYLVLATLDHRTLARGRVIVVR